LQTEPNDDSSLLLLQEVGNDEGNVVRYFVCSDCLDLVEMEAGSVQVHDCVTQRDANTLQL
jgi:hypothetical protein